MKWLSSRMQKSEPTVSQNKQYSAEVLGILLQSSTANRLQLIQADAIDPLLQLLSPYRKRDPSKGTEEEEYVENLFASITCCVDESEGKEKLVEAEGIELCLIMLREGKMSKPRALRLLDHALGGLHGAPCCEKLVEAAGLKVIFSILMKKVSDTSRTPKQPLTSASMITKRLNTYLGFWHQCYAHYLLILRHEYDYLPNSWKKTMRRSNN